MLINPSSSIVVGGVGIAINPCEAVASNLVVGRSVDRFLVDNKSTEPTVGTGGISNISGVCNGGGNSVATPFNGSLLCADVHPSGIVVVNEIDVVGHHAVAVEVRSEVDVALDSLSVTSVSGSLLSAEVEDAVAKGDGNVAQQEGDISGAGNTL